MSQSSNSVGAGGMRPVPVLTISMVPPYEVTSTKVKQTLQNPAQIYVENWLIQGMTVIQKNLLELLHILLPALSQHAQ